MVSLVCFVIMKCKVSFKDVNKLANNTCCNTTFAINISSTSGKSLVLVFRNKNEWKLVSP